MRFKPRAATITLVANAPDRKITPTIRSGGRGPRRTELARPGLVVLGLGAAMLVAGCYRAAVELTEGRVRPLVPVAVGAPLAAELLLLVAGIVLVAAGLLIAGSHRREHS